MGANEWRAEVHPGYRTKVIQVGNCIIEINRPTLTEEERVRREGAVLQVLRNTGKEMRQHEKSV